MIFLAANSQARLVSFGTYTTQKDIYAIRSIQEMYSQRDVLFLMANSTAEIQPMSQFLKETQSLCNLLYVGVDQLTDLPVMLSEVLINTSFQHTHSIQLLDTLLYNTPSQHTFSPPHMNTLSLTHPLNTPSHTLSPHPLHMPSHTLPTPPYCPDFSHIKCIFSHNRD